MKVHRYKVQATTSLWSKYGMAHWPTDEPTYISPILWYFTLQIQKMWISSATINIILQSYVNNNKQGPQWPQKLSCHQPPSFRPFQPSEMASFTNSRGQTRKERPNWTRNKQDMTETAKRPVSQWGTEWVYDIYVIREKLSP